MAKDTASMQTANGLTPSI